MNKENEIKLSDKEEAQRQVILNGSLFKTILYISAPIAFYNLISQFFNLFNSLMVADLGKEVFSMVSYVNSLQAMLQSLGAGLSIGGGILIAKFYGQGDFNKTKVYIFNLITFSLFISGLILLTILPFAEIILSVSGVPDDMIFVGSTYFRLETLSVVCIFINQIYLCIEKARGNTKKVMVLNLMVIFIKLVLTYLFVIVLNYEVISVAVSTLASHLSMTVVAIAYMFFSKSNPFKIDMKNSKFRPKIMIEMFKLSFPIIFEKVAFSFGKVYVNSLGSIYSPTAVGSLGASNQIGGMVTSVPMGFQSGETTVISQNLGNKNTERAIDTFKATLIINLIYSLVSLVFVYIYMDQMISLFSKDDLAFANEIRKIFSLEMYGTVTLVVSTSVLGLLYGFGHTVMALFINMMRIFLFRIPVVLFFVRFTNMGVEALGYGMFISNLFVGIVAVIYAVYVITRIKKREGLDYKFFSLKSFRAYKE